MARRLLMDVAMRSPTRTLLPLLTVVLSSGLASVAHGAVPGYGKRSQVGQLIRAVDQQKSGKTPRPTVLRRQPLVQKLVAFLRPGLTTKDDVKKLEGFLTEAKAQLGGGEISTLEHPALEDGQRMRVEKALALLKYDRRPAEVTETFIRTTAKVEGFPELEQRDLFVQRWRPIGKPSGKVYVMAPGFLQSGRNFYEQVQLLNKAGHDVVVMDQQWAGYTASVKRGVVKGEIDSGYGIARDVADLAAYGNAIVETEYGQHAGKQLVLVGTSMGGGPGVLGALKLYDEGAITLPEGKSIPRDRGWIIQGGFLGRNKTLINNTLDFLGRVPGVRRLPLPAMGVPLLNDDPATNVKLAAHAAAEDLRGRPQAFRAAVPLISDLLARIAKSGAPAGRGFIIHAQKDHLADARTMVRTVARMQATAQTRVGLKFIGGKDHVIEETPSEARYILEAAAYVDGK
jgi:pimeloyl-ACP methyl ester carboxylesterase